MTRKRYASDISRERFAEIELLLRSVRRRTKNDGGGFVRGFYAVLYLLRTGYQWRFLPNEFPKWTTVYAYFSKWNQPDQYGVSLLEQALKNQVAVARTGQGRDAATAFLIVDAQSAKNTDTAAHKGYDAGKKVSGIKQTSYCSRHAGTAACRRGGDCRGDRSKGDITGVRARQTPPGPGAESAG